MNAYKMKKSQINTLKAAVLATLLLPMASFAELKSMADEELAATQAQAGVNIGIDMKINVDKNTGNHSCPANSSDCQFGIKLDNMNNPAWLTLTGVSGGVNIRKINVQSSTVGTGVNEKEAIRIGFDPSQKITFTDFGFNSLRVAKDTATIEGYRTVLPYGGNASNALDAGRQAGLLGVRINGDVAVSGAIKMFNCGTC